MKNQKNTANDTSPVNIKQLKHPITAQMKNDYAAYINKSMKDHFYHQPLLSEKMMLTSSAFQGKIETSLKQVDSKAQWNTFYNNFWTTFQYESITTESGNTQQQKRSLLERLSLILIFPKTMQAIQSAHKRINKPTTTIKPAEKRDTTVNANQPTSLFFQAPKNRFKKSEKTARTAALIVRLLPLLSTPILAAILFLSAIKKIQPKNKKPQETETQPTKNNPSIQAG